MSQTDARGRAAQDAGTDQAGTTTLPRITVSTSRPLAAAVVAQVPKGSVGARSAALALWRHPGRAASGGEAERTAGEWELVWSVDLTMHLREALDVVARIEGKPSSVGGDEASPGAGTMEEPLDAAVGASGVSRLQMLKKRQMMLAKNKMLMMKKKHAMAAAGAKEGGDIPSGNSAHGGSSSQAGEPAGGKQVSLPEAVKSVTWNKDSSFVNVVLISGLLIVFDVENGKIVHSVDLRTQAGSSVVGQSKSSVSNSQLKSIDAVLWKHMDINSLLNDGQGLNSNFNLDSLNLLVNTAIGENSGISTHPGFSIVGSITNSDLDSALFDTDNPWTSTNGGYSGVNSSLSNQQFPPNTESVETMELPFTSPTAEDFLSPTSFLVAPSRPLSDLYKVKLSGQDGNFDSKDAGSISDRKIPFVDPVSGTISTRQQLHQPQTGANPLGHPQRGAGNGTQTESQSWIYPPSPTVVGYKNSNSTNTARGSLLNGRNKDNANSIKPLLNNGASGIGNDYENNVTLLVMDIEGNIKIRLGTQHVVGGLSIYDQFYKNNEEQNKLKFNTLSVSILPTTLKNLDDIPKIESMDSSDEITMEESGDNNTNEESRGVSVLATIVEPKQSTESNDFDLLMCWFGLFDKKSSWLHKIQPNLENLRQCGEKLNDVTHELLRAVQLFESERLRQKKLFIEGLGEEDDDNEDEEDEALQQGFMGKNDTGAMETHRQIAKEKKLQERNDRFYLGFIQTLLTFDSSPNFVGYISQELSKNQELRNWTKNLNSSLKCLSEISIDTIPTILENVTLLLEELLGHARWGSVNGVELLSIESIEFAIELTFVIMIKIQELFLLSRQVRSQFESFIRWMEKVLDAVEFGDEDSAAANTLGPEDDHPGIHLSVDPEPILNFINNGIENNCLSQYFNGDSKIIRNLMSNSDDTTFVLPEKENFFINGSQEHIPSTTFLPKIEKTDLDKLSLFELLSIFITIVSPTTNLLNSWSILACKQENSQPVAEGEQGVKIAGIRQSQKLTSSIYGTLPSILINDNNFPTTEKELDSKKLEREINPKGCIRIPLIGSKDTTKSLHNSDSPIKSTCILWGDDIKRIKIIPEILEMETSRKFTPAVTILFMTQVIHGLRAFDGEVILFNHIAYGNSVRSANSGNNNYITRIGLLKTSDLLDMIVYGIPSTGNNGLSWVKQMPRDSMKVSICDIKINSVTLPDVYTTAGDPVESTNYEGSHFTNVCVRIKLATSSSTVKYFLVNLQIDTGNGRDSFLKNVSLNQKGSILGSAIQMNQETSQEFRGRAVKIVNIHETNTPYRATFDLPIPAMA